MVLGCVCSQFNGKSSESSWVKKNEKKKPKVSIIEEN